MMKRMYEVSFESDRLLTQCLIGYWLSLAFYKGAGRTTLRFHWSYEQRCFIGIFEEIRLRIHGRALDIATDELTI